MEGDGYIDYLRTLSWEGTILNSPEYDSEKTRLGWLFVKLREYFFSDDFCTN